MKVSFDQWMKDPAKWMKRPPNIIKTCVMPGERLEQWSKTPQGQQRIKEYLLKQGYTPYAKTGIGTSAPAPIL